MNVFKRLLVDHLSDKQLRVLRGFKRWITRDGPEPVPLSSPEPHSGHPTLLDFAGTIPQSIFDRRPVQECRSPQGTYFLPVDAIQDPAARAIRSGRVMEPEILRAAGKYIIPGTIVLDIGAGFGQLPVLFSPLAGDAGQVLAFEADEYVFDILQRNIRANQCGNIRAFLGAAIDRLKIQAPVSFMHAHAPGSELHALRGAVDAINRFRMPIAVELDEVTGSGSAPADLAAFLRSVRYRVDSRIGASGCLALPEERSSVASIKPAGAGRGPVEFAHPGISISRAPFQDSLCKLLKSRQEVEKCTRFLKLNGFVSHNLHCKDWDLAHIVPEIGDGNFLDMGSSDSYILMNLSLKRIRGELHGIDLQQPDVPVNGVRYSVGDLMETGLPGGHFSNIACLSVLEHQIDFARFAAEASRLLVPGGRLFVTFDYWEPKVRAPIKLYGLEWQPLDAEALRRFIAACAAAGLRMVHDFDWRSGERVIHWGYYSPHPEVGYTFGMAAFRKN